MYKNITFIFVLLILCLILYNSQENLDYNKIYHKALHSKPISKKKCVCVKKPKNKELLKHLQCISHSC